MDIVKEAIAQLRVKRDKAARNRAYYDGNQERAYLGDDESNPIIEKAKYTQENVCALVVDTTMSRLLLSGYEPGDLNSDLNSDEATRAWDWLERTGGLKGARAWMKSQEITGLSAAVIVWRDGLGRIRPMFQEPEAVAHAYDAEYPDILLWVAKYWKDDKKHNLTIWTRDEVIVATAADTFAGLPDARTFATVSVEPHSFGAVPAYVVEPTEGNDLTSLIPLQNALNQNIAHSILAGFYFALPFRVFQSVWSDAIDPETGLPIPPARLGKDTAIMLQGSPPDVQDQKVYDLPGQNPEPFLKERESLISSIARVTRTPAHVLKTGTQMPSGEALKTAESPYIAKIKARMELYGAAIAACGSLAVALENTLTGESADWVRLETLWLPPESSSTESNSNIVRNLVDAGVPIDVVGMDYLGWDEEKARSISERMAIEADDRAQAAAAIFDAGVTGGI